MTLNSLFTTAVVVSLVVVVLSGCDQQPAAPSSAAPPPPGTGDAMIPDSMPPAVPPAAPPATQPAATQPAAAPVKRPDTEPFKADGVIVAIEKLFTAVPADEPFVAAGVAGKVLVTADGIYAFIETPGNLEKLEAASGGTPVRVTGMVHHPGRLLHIDSIERVMTLPPSTVALDSSTAVPTTLTSKNVCQCGIKIAELHTSCKLGHYHYLQADDGKIYHYLQTAAGRDAFKGTGSHFKRVEVTGIVLPGQFILAESVTVQ